MMPFRRNRTRIPRMGGDATRSSTIRNYIGQTGQYGTATGRPAGSTEINTDAALNMTPSLGSAGNLRRREPLVEDPVDVERNRPEGGGGQMSAAYVPPPTPRVNPFFGLGLTNEEKLLKDWNLLPDVKRSGGDVFVSRVLSGLGSGYKWDEGSQRFVAVPNSGPRGF